MTAQDMKLRRVLGFTTNGRNSFIVQPNTGNIIYIAGCVVVILNPQLKSQSHLITNSKQSITTLAITEDGQYLGAANCGLQSVIYIWDLKTMTLVVEFVAHNVEISCMCFSTNGQMLVSVGAQQDMMLSVWDWRKKIRLVNHKVSTKIRAVSFASDNTYFVTVGETHAKYWYIQYDTTTNLNLNDSGTDANISSTLSKDSSLSISCRSATLGEQRRKNFCDVKCGRGLMSDATFCITKDGLLCELNRRRLLHKWVDLRTAAANCLAVSANIIVIGCANGVVRCFNTTELRFLKNLPRPHTLGLDIATAAHQQKSIGNHPVQSSGGQIYPNIIAIGLDESLNAISCVHNDRSLYTWDLSDSNGKVVKRYSAMYHSSCIWGIDTYPGMATNPLLPPGSFITCSSDDTLRIWHPDVFNSRLVSRDKQESSSKTIASKLGGGKAHSTTINKPNVYHENPFSDELSKIIFTDSTHKFLCDLDGLGQVGVDLDYDSTEGLRCLKISPSGTQLAVGNRSGAIRVFDFELDAEIKNIAAHDAEVLCLEYSDPRKFSGYCYLASSSRDKLIHIFDASNNYTFLQTIDDHLSSITALRFVNNRARDCLQLISCGADQRIIFRNGLSVSGRPDGAGQLNFVTDQHIEGKTTFYDMDVDSESSCLITACQDRMIRLFNVAQVRYQSGFKGSVLDEGTLIKIALDPSCTFLAASSTNKSISVYDYQRGECLASVNHGLSDLITDMKFSPDGRHLVACSGDGCIFIWKSPAEIANAIGGNDLGLAQLSLSSCSLGSLNGKQTDLDADDTLEMAKPRPFQQRQQLKPKPDWGPRQQMLGELGDRYGKRANSGESGSVASNQRRLIEQEQPPPTDTHKSSTNEDALYEDVRSLLPPPPTAELRARSHPAATDPLNPNCRYQVQNAARATTTSSDFGQPPPAAEDDNDDYDTVANGGHYATVRSPDNDDYGPPRSYVGSCSTNETATSGISIQSRRSSDGLVARNLGQMSNLAKAKLFQSRENLERITTRERFLQEGLAHGGDQVSRRNDKSSLSGLFNTKLNCDDRLGAAATDHDDDEIVDSGDCVNYALPTRSSPSFHPDQRSNNSTNNHTINAPAQAVVDNNNKRLVNSPLSSSSSDDELSSEPDDGREQIIGTQLSNRQLPNRPITPPKPSLHRQIRRNSVSVHHLNRNEGGLPGGRQLRSSAQQAGRHPLTNTSPLRGAKAGQRRFQAQSSGGTTGGTSQLRASRSECNLDLSLAARLDQSQPLKLGAGAATTTTGQLDGGAQALNGRQLPQADNLIYCEKLDLSKLNPASAPLSQELCQYVVDELQALSKYATRLHQRLQANGNRGLSNMVARGVQNSMDILSIVPPRSMHHYRIQSQVNLSPVSMLSRRKQQPLRRPASSNSILDISSSAITPAAAYFATQVTAAGEDGGSHKRAHSTTTKTYGLKRGNGDGSTLLKADDEDDYMKSLGLAHDLTYRHHGPSDSSPSTEAALVGSGSSCDTAAANTIANNPQLVAAAAAAAKPAQPSSTASIKTSVSGAQSRNNNQLNLDQVLAAYSDRLFRMVQERMAAEQPTTTPPASSASGSHKSPANGSNNGGTNDNFASASAKANDRPSTIAPSR